MSFMSATASLSSHARDHVRAGSTESRHERLSRDADRCVACGLCLPVCPTYLETREEPESARGRIALIRGLVRGELEPTADVVEHLDRCLHCLACEAVCPAGVAYGALADGGQAFLRERNIAASQPAPVNALAWLVRTRMRLYLLGLFLFAFRVTGLRWLTERSGLARLLGTETAVRYANVHTPRYGWRRTYAAYGVERGSIALFTGCVANLVDRDSIRAAIEVLRTSGFRVEVPREQGCCGAIDLHAGNQTGYLSAQRRNENAFSSVNVDAFVHLASGCGAVLNQGAQDRHLGAGQEREAASVRFIEINDFLAEALKNSTAEPVSRTNTGDANVYLHIPCSMKKAKRAKMGVESLFQQLGQRFKKADNGDLCCGAAGTYSLKYPKLAEDLGMRIVQEALRNRCTSIATCNVGCAMHLKGIIDSQGLQLRVEHAVEVVEQHLARRGSTI